MIDNAIEVQDLTKTFDERDAVRHLSFSVPRGSVFGFLGANGAGKTTTIRAMVGHMHPTEGTVRILGSDPWAMNESQRRRVAYVSENMALPGWMSASQAMRYCAAQTPLWDETLADKLRVDFKLQDGKPYRQLSKGQRRRICILTALCSGADLLVLDEPAANLDVEARRQLLDQILEIACDGRRTVFFSSHLLTDLERVVDRVGMLDAGRLCLEGDLETLKAHVRRLNLPDRIEPQVLDGYFNLLRYEVKDNHTVAVVSDFDLDRMRALCGEFNLTEEPVDSGFSLEDLFLEIRQASGTLTTTANDI